MPKKRTHGFTLSVLHFASAHVYSGFWAKTTSASCLTVSLLTLKSSFLCKFSCSEKKSSEFARDNDNPIISRERDI